MTTIPNAPVLSNVPHITDPAARAIVRAVMDADIIGVALLRGPGFVHEIVNAKYQSLVGDETRPTLGRRFSEVVPRPDSVVARVLGGRGPAVEREVLFLKEGLRNSRYVTFTYHSVDDTSVLVFAQDVTDHVRERGRAELFVALAGELLSNVDPRAAVRSAVTRTQLALGASASSIFVIVGDELHGAIGDWDWTRTSFKVPLAAWPTVAASLAHGNASYLTVGRSTGAEAGWFERRGISGALCVPMRTPDAIVGVLFYDFDTQRPPDLVSTAFAESVADHCAATLLRATS